MSRTSHRWHYVKCPHCGVDEKVQNRSHRYVAPNNVVVSGRPHYITGYNVNDRVAHSIEGQVYRTEEIRRTTVHRLACARKHGVPLYEAGQV